MKLTFVRHGQTDANVQSVMEGHTSGVLNVTGMEQAKKVAERLQNEQFAAIYVSDLARAKMTAKAIVQHHPSTPVVHTEELRERNWGAFEGKRKKDLLAEDEQLAFASFEDFKPAEGESFVEMQERMKEFYVKLVSKHLGQSVLVVGHAGIFTSLLLHLLVKEHTREAFAKLLPENTAVTVLEVGEDKRHVVKVLNCTEHLD